MKKTTPRRWSSFALALAYVLTNVVGASAGEGRFWDDRKKAAQRLRAETHEGLGLPASSLSDGQRQLLAQLPAAGRMDFRVTEPTALSGALTATPARGFEKADLGHVPSWISSLVLPYAAVRDIHLSSKPGAPLVIHVQDAHGIEEAQRNVAGLIDGLRQERGISLVGLEGAAGAFGLDPYRAYPDPAVTKAIADCFLKDATLTGAEYAALTAPAPPLLWGVEDQTRYEENIQSFKDSLKNKPAVAEYLTNLGEAAALLRGKLYAPSLQEFDRHAAAYDAGREGLGAHVRYLLGAFSGEKTRFPNLRLLTEALQWEDGLDFKRVEKDRLSLVEALSRRLPEAALNRLVQQSLLYRAGRMTYGDYYRFLRGLCAENKISLGDFGSLSDYITYVLVAERINRNDLLEELSKLESSLQDSLAAGVAEKRLVEASRDLRLLDKLTSHAMAPGDWFAYQTRRRDVLNAPTALKVVALEAGGMRIEIPRRPENFEALLAPFEAFCAYALERNNALVDNLLAKMKTERAPAALLVAGGFHTDGLTQILRRKDVSYVVLTPKITDVPKGGRYLDVLAKDPLPLEKMFQGDVINLVAPQVGALSNAGDERSKEFKIAAPILEQLWGNLAPDEARRLAPGLSAYKSEGDLVEVQLPGEELLRLSFSGDVHRPGGLKFESQLRGAKVAARIGPATDFSARLSFLRRSLMAFSGRVKAFIVGENLRPVSFVSNPEARAAAPSSQLMAGSMKLLLPGTVSLRARWEKELREGTAGRLAFLKQFLVVHPRFSDALTEEVPVRRAEWTWPVSFFLSRAPAITAGLLIYVGSYLTVGGSWVSVPGGAFLTAWLAMTFMQQRRFVQYHENETRKQFVVRAVGTAVLNGLAVAPLMTAAAFKLFATPLLPQVSPLLLGAAGSALGWSLAISFHYAWNRWMPADYQLTLEIGAEENLHVDIGEARVENSGRYSVVYLPVQRSLIFKVPKPNSDLTKFNEEEGPLSLALKSLGGLTPKTAVLKNVVISVNGKQEFHPVALVQERVTPLGDALTALPRPSGEDTELQRVAKSGEATALIDAFFSLNEEIIKRGIDPVDVKPENYGVDEKGQALFFYFSHIKDSDDRVGANFGPGTIFDLKWKKFLSGFPPEVLRHYESRRAALKASAEQLWMSDSGSRRPIPSPELKILAPEDLKTHQFMRPKTEEFHRLLGSLGSVAMGSLDWTLDDGEEAVDVRAVLLEHQEGMSLQQASGVFDSLLSTFDGGRYSGRTRESLSDLEWAQIFNAALDATLEAIEVLKVGSVKGEDRKEVLRGLLRSGRDAIALSRLLSAPRKATLILPGTVALRARWERELREGTAGRLAFLKRFLLAHPHFSDALTEEVPVRRAEWTWPVSFFLSRAPAVAAGALALIAAHLAGGGPWMTVPSAAFLSVWLAMTFMQQRRFVQYHENETRRQFVVRAVGTGILNGLAVAPLMTAAAFKLFATPLFPQVSPLVIGAAGSALGWSLAISFHYAWNRWMPAAYQLSLPTSPDETASSVEEGPAAEASASESNPASRGPPFDLSAEIDRVIALDDEVKGLTLENAGDFTSHYREMVGGEGRLLQAVRNRTTDNDSSFPVLQEIAEDKFFAGNNDVYMSMLNLPMAHLTKVAEKHGIHSPADFADAVKARLGARLAEAETFRAAVDEKEKSLRPTYFGTRIMILGLTPDANDILLEKVIPEVLRETAEDFARQALEAAKGDRLKELEERLIGFEDEVASTSFFGAHAQVALAHDGDLPPDHENPAGAFQRFNTKYESRLYDLEKKYKGKPEYYEQYRKYQKERRRELQQWARLFRDQSLYAAAASESTRESASQFIELLLASVYEEDLFARSEFVEKASAELSGSLNDLFPEGVRTVSILNDARARKLESGLGPRQREVYFQGLHEGYLNKVPLFAYETRRLPRQLARLKRLYNDRDFRKTYAHRLSETFRQFKKEPTAENLARFKEIYGVYRTAMDEALLLSYRDARLPEVHKLKWLEEVVQADAAGAWEKWLAHLKEKHTDHLVSLEMAESRGLPEDLIRGNVKDSRFRSTLFTKWVKIREEEFKGHRSEQSALENALRLQAMARLERLIQPGFFVAKRPIGDETFLVRAFGDPSRSGRRDYYAAFGELNGGNAYFKAYTPDNHDSVMHEILLQYLDLYRRREPSEAKPFAFLESLNAQIAHLTTPGDSFHVRRFQATAKVTFSGRETERMKLYIRKGASSPDGSESYPMYAVSRTGEVFVRESADHTWTVDVGIRPEDMEPLETTLSAGVVTTAHPIAIGRGEISRQFYRLDKYNANQKKTHLAKKIASDEEIRSLRFFAAAQGYLSSRPSPARSSAPPTLFLSGLWSLLIPEWADKEWFQVWVAPLPELLLLPGLSICLSLIFPLGVAIPLGSFLMALAHADLKRFGKGTAAESGDEVLKFLVRWAGAAAVTVVAYWSNGFKDWMTSDEAWAFFEKAYGAHALFNLGVGFLNPAWRLVFTRERKRSDPPPALEPPSYDPAVELENVFRRNNASIPKDELDLQSAKLRRWAGVIVDSYPGTVLPNNPQRTWRDHAYSMAIQSAKWGADVDGILAAALYHKRVTDPASAAELLRHMPGDFSSNRADDLLGLIDHAHKMSFLPRNPPEGATRDIQYHIEFLKKHLGASSAAEVFRLLNVASLYVLEAVQPDYRQPLAIEIAEIRAPNLEKIGQSDWAADVRDEALRITDPAGYQQAIDWIKTNYGISYWQAERKMSELKARYQSWLDDHGYQDKAFVVARLKSLSSIKDKLDRISRGTEDDILDLFGMQVVFKEGVSRDLGVMEFLKEIATFVKPPEDRVGAVGGFIRHHVNAKLNPEEGGVHVEVQILEYWDWIIQKYGDAAHWMYNLTKLPREVRPEFDHTEDFVRGDYKKSVQQWLRSDASVYVKVHLKDGTYADVRLTEDHPLVVDALSHRFINLFDDSLPRLWISAPDGSGGFQPERPLTLTDSLDGLSGAVIRFEPGTTSETLSPSLAREIFYKSSNLRTKYLAFRFLSFPGLLNEIEDRAVHARNELLGTSLKELDAPVREQSEAAERERRLDDIARQIGLTGHLELYRWLSAFPESSAREEKIKEYRSILSKKISVFTESDRTRREGPRYFMDLLIKSQYDRPRLREEIEAHLRKEGLEVAGSSAKYDKDGSIEWKMAVRLARIPLWEERTLRRSVQQAIKKITSIRYRPLDYARKGKPFHLQVRSAKPLAEGFLEDLRRVLEGPNFWMKVSDETAEDKMSDGSVVTLFDVAAPTDMNFGPGVDLWISHVLAERLGSSYPKLRFEVERLHPHTWMLRSAGYPYALAAVARFLDPSLPKSVLVAGLIASVLMVPWPGLSRRWMVAVLSSWRRGLFLRWQMLIANLSPVLGPMLPSLRGVLPLRPFLWMGWKGGGFSKRVVQSAVAAIVRTRGYTGWDFKRLQALIDELSEGADETERSRSFENLMAYLAQIPSDFFSLSAVRVILVAAGRTLRPSAKSAHRDALSEALRSGGLEGVILPTDVKVLLRGDAAAEADESFATVVPGPKGRFVFLIAESKLDAWKKIEDEGKPGYLVNALIVFLYHELAHTRGMDRDRPHEIGLDEDGLNALYAKDPDAARVSAAVVRLGRSALGEMASRAEAAAGLAATAPVGGKISDEVEASLRLARKIVPVEMTDGDFKLARILGVSDSQLESLRADVETFFSGGEPALARAGYAGALMTGASKLPADRTVVYGYISALARRPSGAAAAIRESLRGYLTAASILSRVQRQDVGSLAKLVPGQMFPVLIAPAGLTGNQAAWIAKQILKAEQEDPRRLSRGFALAAENEGARRLLDKALRAAGVKARAYYPDEKKARGDDGLIYVEKLLQQLPIYGELWKEVEASRIAIPVLSPVIADVTTGDERLKAAMVLLQVLADKLVRVSVDALKDIRAAVLVAMQA